MGVIDLEADDKNIDKSSIGCYVYLDETLKNVLVISELEQKLELQFNNKQQIIQIVVKQLGNSENKYGEYKFQSKFNGQLIL